MHQLINRLRADTAPNDKTFAFSVKYFTNTTKGVVPVESILYSTVKCSTLSTGTTPFVVKTEDVKYRTVRYGTRQSTALHLLGVRGGKARVIRATAGKGWTICYFRPSLQLAAVTHSCN